MAFSFFQWPFLIPPLGQEVWHAFLLIFTLEAVFFYDSLRVFLRYLFLLVLMLVTRAGQATKCGWLPQSMLCGQGEVSCWCTGLCACLSECLCVCVHMCVSGAPGIWEGLSRMNWSHVVHYCCPAVDIRLQPRLSKPSKILLVNLRLEIERPESVAPLLVPTGCLNTGIWGLESSHMETQLSPFLVDGKHHSRSSASSQGPHRAWVVPLPESGPDLVPSQSNMMLQEATQMLFSVGWLLEYKDVGWRWVRRVVLLHPLIHLDQN